FSCSLLLSRPHPHLHSFPTRRCSDLPGARLVKAFNTMGWNTLASGSRPAHEDRLVVFIAGDDAAAKSTVANLIDDIGFASIDTGSLRVGGRRQQPGWPIYGEPMTVREAKKILG